MGELIALKPKPRLLTLDGLLTHHYIEDQETLDYIKEMIKEARTQEHMLLDEYLNTPATRRVTYRNDPSAAFDDGNSDAKYHVKKWSQNRKEEIKNG